MENFTSYDDEPDRSSDDITSETEQHNGVSNIEWHLVKIEVECNELINTIIKNNTS